MSYHANAYLVFVGGITIAVVIGAFGFAINPAVSLLVWAAAMTIKS